MKGKEELTKTTKYDSFWRAVPQIFLRYSQIKAASSGRELQAEVCRITLSL